MVRNRPPNRLHKLRCGTPIAVVEVVRLITRLLFQERNYPAHRRRGPLWVEEHYAILLLGMGWGDRPSCEPIPPSPNGTGATLGGASSTAVPLPRESRPGAGSCSITFVLRAIARSRREAKSCFTCTVEFLPKPRRSARSCEILLAVRIGISSPLSSACSK